MSIKYAAAALVALATLCAACTSAKSRECRIALSDKQPDGSCLLTLAENFVFDGEAKAGTCGAALFTLSIADPKGNTLFSRHRYLVVDFSAIKAFERGAYKFSITMDRPFKAPPESKGACEAVVALRPSHP
jgi:hypothetical protein